MIALPEILDEIVENSRDDRKALLSLGWIAKRAFTRSRRYLFSALQFDNDKDFDRFLDLVDVPWTSFTPFVRHIHFKGMFEDWDDDYSSSRNTSRIKANLCNLKSVWLTTTRSWRIKWHLIPPHVLDLFFQPSVRDLQFDSLNIRNADDVVDLFNRLQTSIHPPVFYGLFCHYPPDSSRNPAVFRRPFRFTLLDSLTLTMCRNVWDPLMTKNLDIRAHTFYVGHMTTVNALESVPFVSRFLSQIGPSVERLVINISESGGRFSDRLKQHHEAMDYSKCINVRKLHIGDVGLNRQKEEESRPMVSLMWHLLAALPSPSVVEEISLTFETRDNQEGMLADLAAFEWTGLVSKLHQNFQNAKIKIGVAVYYLQSTTLDLETVRHEDKLKALEEQGDVELAIYDLEKSLDYGPLWREITGIGTAPRL